jgi:ABC-type dipeptide/oligopeptide/nickel transport system ATPase subunit
MALLEVRDLVKHFPVHGGLLNRIVSRVHAVNGVSFDVEQGEILGVVGESGCGKSTLGKVLTRLYAPTSGSVAFEGTEISDLGHAALMPFRRRLQMIFQDPYSSLNPRMTVNSMLKEVIRFHRIVPREEIDGYIDELLATVGLRTNDRRKFPHEFSGGQRQRLGIARALALKPEFLVADEPVSALDVSIQAQVLNLLTDLKEELGLTVLFIDRAAGGRPQPLRSSARMPVRHSLPRRGGALQRGDAAPGIKGRRDARRLLGRLAVSLPSARPDARPGTPRPPHRTSGGSRAARTRGPRRRTPCTRPSCPHSPERPRSAGSPPAGPGGR